MWTSILLRLGFTDFVALRLIGSLLLTLAVELPVAWLLGFRSRRELLAVTLVNVVTNPPLVLVLVGIDALAVGQDATLFVPLVAVLEVATVVIEWFLLRWATRRSWRDALKVSFWANAASFVVGLFFWTALAFVIASAINAAWVPFN